MVLIPFLLGGGYLFFILNMTYLLMFGDFPRLEHSYLGWVYLVPIVILFPGWLGLLVESRNTKEVIYWMLLMLGISIFINFMTHYGLGTGDLGPGPV